FIRLAEWHIQAHAGAAVEDTRAVWAAWEACKPAFLQASETSTLAVLVHDCLLRLPDILRGTLLVTDVLFPHGSMHKIAGLYQNDVCDYFNTVVAEVVQTYMQQRLAVDSRATIRILEIGAGTGGTTSIVLPALRSFQEHVETYSYTDLSRSFL